jgi:hypothetical protein
MASVLRWFSYSDYSFGIFRLFSLGHCIVCPSLIKLFWLLLWYLQTLLAGPLYCLSFVDLVILITPLVSSNPSRWAIVLSVLRWFSYSDYSVGIFKLYSPGHCIVFPLLIKLFWLLLWYLQTLLAGPLYCLSFVDLVILITPLVSSNSSPASRVWRYQRSNQNNLINNGKTIQCPSE